MKTFAIGNIRPPFHASSLLLQLTENCTWNKCNFCTLYRGGKFKMRSAEEIKRDIDNVAYYRDQILEKLENYDFNTVRMMAAHSPNITWEERRCYSIVLNWIKSDGMKTVFLQDANSIVIKKETLCDILRHLKNTFPTLETVACYGRADTLSRLTSNDFKDLKEAGLNMLHSGYESGCDDVLKLLNKGTTKQQQIDSGKRIKEAGITFNMFYMPGCGGKSLSEKNAVETADVANQIDPDFLRIRTFVLKSGSPMWEMAVSGDFDECSDMEKLVEIRTMIDHLDEKLTGYIISDHIINLLPLLEGYVDKDKAKMLDYIDGFLALPSYKQKEFQLARRMCSNLDYTEMELMPEKYMTEIRDTIDFAKTEDEWEEVLRQYLRKYI